MHSTFHQKITPWCPASAPTNPDLEVDAGSCDQDHLVATSNQLVSVQPISTTTLHNMFCTARITIRATRSSFSTMTSERKRLKSNGLNFVVTDYGKKGATPVVLLHGFPNSANVWEKQANALAKAGFRVIAPDLRGAIGGESDAPHEVEAYNIPKVLVKDVAGIMDALDIEKAYIVGHDWGSQLAWAFAGIYPDRTLKLVAISVGHPSGYMKGDHRGEQKQKSWYVLLLDAPGLGEQAMASGKIMDGLATKEAAEVEGPMWEQLGMIAGMQKPGAITAGLNWYRANAPPESFITGACFDCPSVTCDVLQIWPTGDNFVCSEGQAKSSGQYVNCPGTFRYEKLVTASHFAIWTDPEPVTKLLLDFMKA